MATRRNQSDLEMCECHRKEYSAPVMAPGAKPRSKFADSEIQILQRLVHQECRNGRISESKLRRVYGDIFPMGNAIKYVQLIFKAMDQDQKGYVHCKELLDFLCVAARGSALERASLCFSICDVQGRGAITRTDLLVVLGSIADLVGVDSLGETEEILERIFPRLDAQKTGLVSRSEFLSYFSSETVW